MPNYYNPYNFYPASYMQNVYPNMNQPQMQQSYAPQANQSPKMMEWVEGEVGAKAFQMPNGWPANSPIPLWDSTDTVIYLKSWGPMGIPNPMQKLKYEMPDQQQQALLAAGVGQSGSTGQDNQQNNMPDMSQYVTKSDFDELRKEIRNMNSSATNQNGSNAGQQQNRGGNRNG